MKEQRNGTKCTGEKAPDATAKSQDPEEERTNSEEESDEYKREHEACQIIILFSVSTEVSVAYISIWACNTE